jgi:integrase/recombinase XerD
MERYKPTATFFLDTRKAKANGSFPLKLTIYCKPNKKRYSVNIDLTQDDWNKLNSPKLRDERLREVKIKMGAELQKANCILESLTPFSFTRFESEYFPSAVADRDLTLKGWFDRYIKELEQQGREGTRISYNTTLNSFLGFRPNLKISDITKELLQEYERFMILKKKSPSTIGIYLRQLRAILNQAIAKGVLKPEDYPFKNFEIPASRNIKKSLSDGELEKLLNHEPKFDHQKKALDFWVLSYLCNGMNVTDILHLTPGNVNGRFMHFVRQKTKRTKKKDLRPIKVALSPRALEIISKWRSNNAESPYLFPILEAELTPKTVKHRTQRFIKFINDGMEEVRKDLGFEQKVGTYVARHSFSTRLMRKGVSTQYIKDSLGHSSVAVTENYLGDFNEDVKQEYAQYLTDF